MRTVNLWPGVKTSRCYLKVTLSFYKPPSQSWRFTAHLNGEKMLCVFNLSGAQAELAIDVSVEKEHSGAFSSQRTA